jgi:hypothetical protein
MTRKGQKARERFFMECFLEVAGIRCKTIVDGAEPPDFILTLESGLEVSVEEMEYFSPKRDQKFSRHEIEVAWERFSKVLESEREAQGGLERVHCFLGFKRVRMPPPKTWPALVKAIVGFVKEQASGMTEEAVECTINQGCGSSVLVQNLGYIEIRQSVFPSGWDWNLNAEWLGVDDRELLAAIQGKLGKERIPGEYWLLVVCGERISQSMGNLDNEELNLMNETNTALSHGAYTKVFIYDHMREKAFGWDRKSGWSFFGNYHSRTARG